MSGPQDERAVGSPLDEALTAQLALAAEALRAERLEEVRGAIDRLVAAAPDDVRVQNLRGLYFFRLERFADAQKVYRELATKHPDDAALRLNLGLTELKLGEHAAAAESLRRVTAAEPGNQRAQGYLGLALMRSGDLRGAQTAFSRAGQRELEDRVALRLRELEEEGSLQRNELERAASLGSTLLDGEQPFVLPENEDSSDIARGQGRWQLRAPGERAPLPSADVSAVTPPLDIHGAEPVAAFASARMLRSAAGGEVFALAEGMLITNVVDRLYTRTTGALSSSATLTFEPLRRRVRGQVVDELFGEENEPFFTASGRGTMLVSPLEGQFVLLRLDDDIVYVKEPIAFAFDEQLAWENGRMPGGGPDVTAPRLVQFRGQGRLVLRTERRLFTLKVEPSTSHIVDANALVGWFGRVQPKLLRGDDGEPTSYVECAGEGALLIEVPRT